MGRSNTETAVTDIRRNTRRKFSTEESRLGSSWMASSASIPTCSSPTMAATEMTDTLQDALMVTGRSAARVRHQPRLLSDHGPCDLSGALKPWLKRRDMEHTRGAAYHPPTQGKIERSQRWLKNVVTLEPLLLPVGTGTSPR